MQLSERQFRRRLPLIRPLCPVHGVPMVVYCVRAMLRYHRCPMPNCPCTCKKRKLTK